MKKNYFFLVFGFFLIYLLAVFRMRGDLIRQEYLRREWLSNIIANERKNEEKTIKEEKGVIKRMKINSNTPNIYTSRHIHLLKRE